MGYKFGVGSVNCGRDGGGLKSWKLREIALDFLTVML